MHGAAGLAASAMHDRSATHILFLGQSLQTDFEQSLVANDIRQERFADRGQGCVVVSHARIPDFCPAASFLLKQGSHQSLPLSSLCLPVVARGSLQTQDEHRGLLAHIALSVSYSNASHSPIGRGQCKKYATSPLKPYTL